MEQFHYNPSLLLNRMIENYQIKALLGSGGFSHAYLALDTSLHIDIVLKILHQYMDEHERDAFRVEARTIAQVRHPNIIRVLTLGEYEGIPYYVMDYARRGTLATYVAERGGKLCIEDILTLLYPLGQALSYFHEKTGMVHRDIKPNNILLDTDHTNAIIVRLGDFGFTFPTSSQRIDFIPDIAGTRDYMSPEQRAGKAQSRSDQYALAVVVYQLLTGGYPRNLRISKDMRSLASYGIPESPQLLAVQSVLTKALSLKPQERYLNEVAFMDALTEAAKKSAIVNRRPATSRTDISQKVDPVTSHRPDQQLQDIEQQTSEELNDPILTSYGPYTLSKLGYTLLTGAVLGLGVLAGGTALGLMNFNLECIGITAILPVIGLLMSITLDLEKRKLHVDLYANGIDYTDRHGKHYTIFWKHVTELRHRSYEVTYTSDFGAAGSDTHHEYSISLLDGTSVRIDEDVDSVGLLWKRIEEACPAAVRTEA